MLQTHTQFKDRTQRAIPLDEGFHARFSTPFAVIGVRTAGADANAWVQRIDYLPHGASPLAPRNALAERVGRQLEHYLDDPDYRFNLPYQLEGTPFQQRVWRAISTIASGRTLTYGDIAQKIHSAPRAVGGACGANRLPLLIPCHRVVAVGGLGGFMRTGGGALLEIKQWLLNHEHAGPGR
jgi:methylated-DNA-[protein]-cysteine S-methyltransferase